MEPIVLARTTLLAAAVLLLMMARSLRDNPSDLTGASASSWALNTARLLLFAQTLALLMVLVAGGGWEGLVRSSLYFDLPTLLGYFAVLGTERLPARRRWSFFTGQAAEFVALLFGIGVGTLAANLIAYAAYDDGLLWDIGGLFGFVTVIQIAVILVVSVMVGAIRFFYNTRLHLERRARDEQEMALMRLREQHALSQLQRLQAQVNPHFLYNALNAIAETVHTDPDRAERMTLALSRLFRAALETSDRPLVTVREELDLVRAYLEIEKARFGERLCCTIDVEPAVLEEPVPRFLLQPLVENAIKHGVSKQHDVGRVGLAIAHAGDGLHIVVRDNGPDFPADLLGGHGWRSVQGSLSLLFPGRHDVALLNGPDKQVRITLRHEA